MTAQSDNSYFQLRALGLERADEDAFTDACFEFGAAGVAEDLKFVQKDLRYDPDVVETARFDVNVYFTETPGEDTLARLQARFPAARLEISREQNKDWLEEWKKGFVPFQFAGPFWVVPSWYPPPPQIDNELWRQILIEPGMAFGTGTHETTRLAAGFVLEEMSRKHKAPPSVLDVGTGTGILALIAARLGAVGVVGLDNDPEARRTGRENLERNGAAKLVSIPETQLNEINEQYDVVIANIIDGVLLKLRDDLVRAVKPGGRLILSGILVEREAEFHQEFRTSALQPLAKRTDGEWTATTYEKLVEKV